MCFLMIHRHLIVKINAEELRIRIELKFMINRNILHYNIGNKKKFDFLFFFILLDLKTLQTLEFHKFSKFFLFFYLKLKKFEFLK